MLEYLTLLKHELKLEFPFGKKKAKKDIVGSALSLLITLIIAFVFIFFLSTVVNNYTIIKVNKIEAPLERAEELLNALYLVCIIAISFLCTEKMRKTLTQKSDKEIFLRLPVKPQTIFLSKLTVLLIWTYIISLVIILTINIIFFIVLKPSFIFWLTTILVWIFLPMVSFLISCILIIPYIKLIDFIKEKNIIIFIGLSLLLVVSFLVYTKFLSVVQQLLETGSIKFLFNEKFTNFLQNLLKYAYPANSLTKIALADNMLLPLLIVLLIAVISVVAVYFVTKNLYYITLYKFENRKSQKVKKESNKQLKPIEALIKKEFITIFREPRHLFSYFSIAVAMPVMVYSCYTLFESLIKNTIGLKITFSLGLLVILIFSVLTNTFCSTNITRDGLTNLKAKIIPIEPSKIMMAKVIFCSFVSSLAVLLSSILLIAATSLTVFEGLLCAVIGIMFSVTQVFIATRMDLNGAKISFSQVEVEQASSKTIAKVVFIGLFVSFLVGLLSLVISILSKGSSIDFVQNLNLKEAYAYILPFILGSVYCTLGIIYYKKNIEKSFDNLTM
mgnify:CR=1 FL=1